MNARGCFAPPAVTFGAPGVVPKAFVAVDARNSRNRPPVATAGTNPWRQTATGGEVVPATRPGMSLCEFQDTPGQESIRMCSNTFWSQRNFSGDICWMVTSQRHPRRQPAGEPRTMDSTPTVRHPCERCHRLGSRHHQALRERWRTSNDPHELA